MSKNKNQQPTTFSLYACYRFLVEDVDSGHYPAPPVKNDVEVLDGSADELLYDAMTNADIVNLDALYHQEEICEEGDRGYLSMTASKPVSFTLTHYADCEFENTLNANIIFLLLPEKTLDKYNKETFSDDAYNYTLEHLGSITSVNFVDDWDCENNDDHKFSEIERWVDDIRKAARKAAFSPYAYFRILNNDYEGDIATYAEEAGEVKIHLSRKNDDPASYTITMPEMAGHIYNGDEYLFHVAYVNIKESLADMLGLDGTAYVELTHSYEMGVVKVQDNLWIEALNDDTVPAYELGDYWWNQHGMAELKLMMARPGGFAEWMSSIGADNLTYYSYLRHSDGMETLYSFSAFKGRRRLASFTLTPFDLDAGAKWVEGIQDAMRNAGLTGFTVYHAGEKEENWDLNIPARAEAHSVYCFSPAPPVMPAKGYSIGVVALEPDCERNGMLTNAFVTPKSLSQFPGILAPNEVQADGVILPPLKLPLVKKETEKGTILHLDFDFINNVIKQAAEDGVSIDQHDAIYKRFALETGMLEGSTMCIIGSVVIFDMQKDMFFDYANAYLGFVDRDGTSEEWIAGYNRLFPGLNTKTPFFVPYLNMDA